MNNIFYRKLVLLKAWKWKYYSGNIEKGFKQLKSSEMLAAGFSLPHACSNEYLFIHSASIEMREHICLNGCSSYTVTRCFHMATVDCNDLMLGKITHNGSITFRALNTKETRHPYWDYACLHLE